MKWNGLLATLVTLAILGTGSAFAQPNRPPVRPPLEPPVERPTIPGPRFTVKAISFEALDETGLDFTGSDEVVTIFGGRNYTLVTGEVGSVDSDGRPRVYGEHENCIFPPVDTDGKLNRSWTCNPRGGSAPLFFRIALFEQDIPFPGFCIPLPSGSDILPVNAQTCAAHDTDVLIGSVEQSFSRERLAKLLPRPGNRVRVRVYLACGNGTCGDGTEYRVIYEIRRVRDAR